MNDLKEETKELTRELTKDLTGKDPMKWTCKLRLDAETTYPALKMFGIYYGTLSEIAGIKEMILKNYENMTKSLESFKQFKESLNNKYEERLKKLNADAAELKTEIEEIHSKLPNKGNYTIPSIDSKPLTKKQLMRKFTDIIKDTNKFIREFKKIEAQLKELVKELIWNH